MRERRSNGVVLRYAYDALGNLATIQYTNVDNWTRTFYVRTKLNGDVDQIYDTSGNLIAKYTYDAWGNTISITDADGNAITASTHVAVVNPIRYRGYYWDAETGFYYLQSRYYDPETKRFVNADGYVFTGQDMQSGNMFAYCGNCPVNRYDPNGNMHMSDGGGGFRTEEQIQKEIEKWQVYFRIQSDLKNYDSDNEDINKVFKSNYFSSYKGTFVWRHSSSFLTSWSISGVIFLNHSSDKKELQVRSNLLNHEYGHILQERELGLYKYMHMIAIPSVTYNLLSRGSKVLNDNYYNMPWEYDADIKGNVSRSHMVWSKPLAELYYTLWEEMG